jgi:arginase
MNIDIIDMPIDYGADRHGSEMGPAAIRLAGLKEELLALGHGVSAAHHPEGLISRDDAEVGDSRLKYLEPILSACTWLSTRVEEALDRGLFPLVLGGDHSLSLGSLAGLRRALGGDKRLSLLYVDAHGDFNTTETSPSGNIHGMSLAACAGLGDARLARFGAASPKVAAADILYAGLRDLDAGEKRLMRDAGVAAYPMSAIDRMGFPAFLGAVRDFFKAREPGAVYVSFDLDALDPLAAPGVGITVPGGLTIREAFLLMEEMHSISGGNLVGAEIVEMNPVMDMRSQTARIAVELIARLLGKKIY